MSKPKVTWHWHARSFEGTAHVRLLLCKRYGKVGTESYAWGFVLPRIAEEIAQATGLPLERDDVPYADDGKTQPAELTPVGEQGRLF